MTPKDDILTQFAPESLTIEHAQVDKLSRLFPHVDEASELMVLCHPGQFCASEIARAVEDCDAHLLNLNVTAERTADGDNLVALRINHANGASVARSLERYGYEVVFINDNNEVDANIMRERINELMHYLEV